MNKKSSSSLREINHVISYSYVINSRMIQELINCRVKISMQNSVLLMGLANSISSYTEYKIVNTATCENFFLRS